jgi:hypothetical protein
MTQQHPITPPPELVRQWSTASPIQYNDQDWTYELFIAHHAAQWGADQELEACCEWLDGVGDLTLQLRADRRPKQPSLKKQALDALESVKQRTTDPNIIEPLRRALEQLDD